MLLWALAISQGEVRVDILSALYIITVFRSCVIINRALTIDGRKVRTTEAFRTYWYFAFERQRIFFQRLGENEDCEHTQDPILSTYKFTNTYRASDRVSQYLIRNVIYRDDLPKQVDEVFFRILLFKLFNKIETWELLERKFGQLTIDSFDAESYSAALTDSLERKHAIYSAAYIIPSCGRIFGKKYKHENHLLLLSSMLESRIPTEIAGSNSMENAYINLRQLPSIGPFLAYQFVTDINYSEITNFGEDEFVVAGPGALDGISKCFLDGKGLSAEAVIRHMFEHQEDYFSDYALDFQSLWGRRLQLVDCQNIFCELSKYSRVAHPSIKGIAGRNRIKQKYNSKGYLPSPWYPPKWNLNQQIRDHRLGAEAYGAQASLNLS